MYKHTVYVLFKCVAGDGCDNFDVRDFISIYVSKIDAIADRNKLRHSAWLAGDKQVDYMVTDEQLIEPEVE